MGVWDLFFLNILTCCTCCRMNIKGGGGCINVLDEHFLYVTEDAHVAHAVVWSSGGVPSSSVLTADGATGFAASCDKDYPHKRFKMAEVNHKENIFTKTYYFLGRLWGKSYRTIVAGTQQMDGTWKHLKKWRPPSMLHKKSKTCTKKIHLGLQLDMASQRYLIADCGFCFATSALAPLASRRGKNWKSERRPWRAKFLMFFFDPWRAKWSHRAGETHIFTLESHACQSKWMSKLQTFFDDSCKYQHFVSYPQKSEFQNHHPYKGAESTGCHVYGRYA